VLSRWKEHFEQHNDDQVDLGDDGFGIDLLNLEEIPEDQQDSRFGFNLSRAAEKRWPKLGALHEVIEQA
jgi:hypothetical protein